MGPSGEHAPRLRACDRGGLGLRRVRRARGPGGAAFLHWDEALERGRFLYGIAADDSHHPGYDSGFAWVWARCAERTQAAVLDALRRGCFYSSTGPEIHELSLDEEAV